MKNKIAYLVNPKASSSIAVFESNITGESMEVSATLGLATMIYRDNMTTNKARELYRELVSKGWQPAKSDGSARFTHNYVWELYQ
jgi:hypothetical protein